MGRLSASDEAQVREIVDEAHTVRLGAHDGVDALLSLLARALGEQPADVRGRRERTLLRKVAPAVRGRVLLHRRLATAPLARRALAAALEALPVAAFVVTARGHLEQANRVGLDRWCPEVRALVLEAVRGGAQAYDVQPICPPGLPRFFLVTQRSTSPGLASVAADRRARWGLTAREAQVLTRVADGSSNRAIAVALGCSERTVEVHVARLREKSRCGSRSALVAAFWGRP